MERPGAATGQQAVNDAIASAQWFAVVVGDPACEITAPSRLLRLWSLLQATLEQIDHVTPPPEGIPRLQRQLRAIRRELENTVSPALAAELRQIAPPRDGALSAAELRMECAVLTSWTGSLTMQMLRTIEAASA
jgi:hypothetical protein